MSSFDTALALKSAGQIWDRNIIQMLKKYIRIPNISPHYDAEWQVRGHMDEAVALLADWAKHQPLANITVRVVRLEGRTPVIFMEIPGTGAPGTVLLYGHLDKQPEGATPWHDGLSPWTPVVEGDRLYGRGAADDGYATFASLTALNLLHQQYTPHARCVVLIEACEESGSYDLPYYVDLLADEIGQPDLVICLDSGCGNYDQLWTTTSLRGVVGGVLRVEIMTEGVHSGHCSGIVPDPFGIIRGLLDRFHDSDFSTIRLRKAVVEVPDDRRRQAEATAKVLGQTVYTEFPFVEGARPIGIDAELGGDAMLLAKTWEPALTVTGADGLPPIAKAGNVLLPFIALKLSLRIPPGVDPKAIGQILKEELERHPPYGAHVTFTLDQTAPGWNAPPFAPWLEASMERASQAFWGKPAMAMGEGGTIPFMGMLGEKFPKALFMITGLLGPGSNAHGPNEFLHIPTAKKLTAAVAQVLADHAMR